MKSTVGVKAMLICQGLQLSSDWDIGNAFVHSGLCFAILFNEL